VFQAYAFVIAAPNGHLVDRGDKVCLKVLHDDLKALMSCWWYFVLLVTGWISAKENILAQLFFFIFFL
jgi:hypothetical protein